MVCTIEPLRSRLLHRLVTVGSHVATLDDAARTVAAKLLVASSHQSALTHICRQRCVHVLAYQISGQRALCSGVLHPDNIERVLPNRRDAPAVKPWRACELFRRAATARSLRNVRHRCCQSLHILVGVVVVKRRPHNVPQAALCEVEP